MRHLQVIVRVPDSISNSEARDYIIAELKAAGGCRRLDDPLFEGLEVIDVKPVKLVL